MSKQEGISSQKQQATLERIKAVRHIGGFAGMDISDDLPLRAAIQEALQDGDWDSEFPLRLSEVMRYVHQGDHHAARLRMERCVRRARTVGSPLQQSQVRFYEGFVARLLGQREEALRLMVPCFEQMLEQGWDRDVAGVGLQLLQSHIILGSFPEAESVGLRGLALTEGMNDHLWSARYAIDLGACYAFQDKDRQALPIFRKALEHALRANSNHYYAFAISNLALVYYRKGWFLSAYRLFMDARNGFQELKEAYWESLMHCNLSMTLCWQNGKAEEGLLHLEEAHRVQKDSGQALPDDLKLDMALIHERFGNPKRSEELVGELNENAAFNRRFVPGRQAWMGYLQLQNSQSALAWETLQTAYKECQVHALWAQHNMVTLLLVRLGVEHPETGEDVANLLKRPLDDLSWLPHFIDDMGIDYWSVYQQIVLESAACLFQQAGDAQQAEFYRQLLNRLRDRAREDDIQRMMSRFPEE